MPSADNTGDERVDNCTSDSDNNEDDDSYHTDSSFNSGDDATDIDESDGETAAVKNVKIYQFGGKKPCDQYTLSSVEHIGDAWDLKDVEECTLSTLPSDTDKYSVVRYVPRGNTEENYHQVRALYCRVRDKDAATTDQRMYILHTGALQHQAYREINDLTETKARKMPTRDAATYALFVAGLLDNKAEAKADIDEQAVAQKYEKFRFKGQENVIHVLCTPAAHSTLRTLEQRVVNASKKRQEKQRRNEEAKESNAKRKQPDDAGSKVSPKAKADDEAPVDKPAEAAHKASKKSRPSNPSTSKPKKRSLFPTIAAAAASKDVSPAKKKAKQEPALVERGDTEKQEQDTRTAFAVVSEGSSPFSALFNSMRFKLVPDTHPVLSDSNK